MIIGYVVSALLACIDALVSLFPSFTINLPGNDGVLAIISAADGVVPVHTASQALLLALTILLGLRLFDFGVWVFHQFWGSS